MLAKKLKSKKEYVDCRRVEKLLYHNCNKNATTARRKERAQKRRQRLLKEKIRLVQVQFDNLVTKEIMKKGRSEKKFEEKD